MAHTRSRRALSGLLSILVALVTATPLAAQAVRSSAGFSTALLPGGLASFVNDVPLPFEARFFGFAGGRIGISEDGYITFGPVTESAGALGLFISPLNADFDTRAGTGSTVTYGADVLGARPAFGINWLNMVAFDPYSAVPPAGRTSFQLVMVDRSDVAPGDFDFEFNFDAVALPDIGYLGGFGPGCLYAPGDPTCPPGVPTQVEIHPDDSGAPTIAGSLNSGVAGRYRYGVRSGAVVTAGLDPVAPSVVPEPTSLSLLLLAAGVAVGGVAVRTRRRR